MNDTTQRTPNFEKSVPGLGEFSLRTLNIPDDIPLVHSWVTQEYAKYWGLQNRSVPEVEAAYREILRPRGSRAFIGLCDGRPAFLMEWYLTEEDPLAKYYEVRPGDHGMHILVAPAAMPIHDFTWHVFTVVMEFMFSDESVERIVVEPDIENEKIHRLNLRAGFEYQAVIQLPKKTAHLAFCTRSLYRAALARNGRSER